jgi:hypothetical protein
MRKLIRLMAGLAVLSLLVMVAPPAAATHWGPAGPDDPSGGVHESAPALAVVVPAIPCVVAGDVVPGTPGALRREHVIPGNQATHSHFTFVDAIINCTDTGGISVDANGGNDGHTFDIGNSNCIELPPNLTGGTCPHPTGAAHQPHHGSTNDSGWSHSSGYAGGSNNLASNACVSGNNRNKANIAAGPGPVRSTGWLKYYRVGVVLYVWGCFTGGPISTSGSPAFSAVLAIFPPSGLFAGAPNPNFPLCLIPEVPPVTPQPAPCGFSVAGAAVRGTPWLPVPVP